MRTTTLFTILILFSISIFIIGVFLLAVFIVQLINLIGFYLVFDLGFYAIGSVFLVWLLFLLALKIMRDLKMAIGRTITP